MRSRNRHSTVFLIQRRHMKRGKYLNSPMVEEWRNVGLFPAQSTEQALVMAEKATGVGRIHLRVVGIATKEK